jgi:hypothetical protein
MTDTRKAQLLEQYRQLEKLSNLERSKRFCRQEMLNEYEDKMAAIETQFQKSGEDFLSAYDAS